MADVQDQTGVRGNLTKEQETKLKELYGLLSRVLGFNKDNTPKNDKPLEKTQSDTASVTSAPKPVKRRTFFGWGGGAAEEPKPAANGTANGDAGTGSSNIQISDANDKYGQTKEFYEALAKYSPEELRTAFWDAVKQDHPDAMLLRFLRARKWDVRKALAMMISSIQWRKTMRIEEDILPRGDSRIRKDLESDDPNVKKDAKDFIDLLRRGESFTFGKDKQGRAVCYVRVCLHKIGVSSQASVERLTVYLIESSRLMLDPGVETACIVFDMTNFSLANMDYPAVKFIIKCFEANYPESLGIVLVHKAPWIFASIWSIIKGWLDPVVAAKVNFTKNTEDVCEHIDRETYMKEFGGNNEYAYEYIEPKDDENDKLDDTETRDSLISVRNQHTKDFQAATEEWINASEDNQALKDKREELAAKISENYWLLDPYVRATHVLDRIGQIKNPTSKTATATTATGAQSLSEKKSTEVAAAKPVAVAAEGN